MKVERKKPWRHLLLLTCFLTWTALTPCHLNTTVSTQQAHTPMLTYTWTEWRWIKACRCFLMQDMFDCALLFLDMVVTVLFSFIKSVCAPLQPRPSYRHWVMSSQLLLPRWPSQQRGLWELLTSSNGTRCTPRSLCHSCSQKREVRYFQTLLA